MGFLLVKLYGYIVMDLSPALQKFTLRFPRCANISEPAKIGHALLDPCQQLLFDREVLSVVKARNR